MRFSAPGAFQLRLLGGFALVIVLALGSVSFYVMQGAEQEIEIYDDLTDRLYLTRMEHWLLGYYAHGGSWENVRASVEEMGVLSGRRIVLTNPDDEVLVDSRHDLMGLLFRPDWPSRHLESYRGVHVGTLYVGPEPTVATAYRQELTRSIGFFLAWGSLAAFVASLLLTAFLTRRLTAPIRTLVAAARRIGMGDFSGQVEVREKGEFTELALAFNGMAQDLARASSFRRNFAADISHELRTPLSNIRGYFEAVEDGLISPATAIDTVRDDALLLHRLVEDLQELALADAGSLTMVYRLHAPGELVEKAILSMERSARTADVRLEKEFSAEQLPEIVVDEQRITQVVRILVENAIVHTPRGGRVVVSISPAPQGITLHVKDSGTGIPPEELERIFERFHRLDTSRARETGGSGLGLTIARYLVTAHNGTVTAENGPAGGSVFTVRLPLIPGA